MSSVKKLAVIGTISALITIIGMTMSVGGFFSFTSKNKASQNTTTPHQQNSQTAYFAGGCFWCIESIFDGTDGVYTAISGYIGGSKETANYKSISSGKTQHREGVKVVYDPNAITYEELINIFWRQIDPTDPEGQFADRGFQYTTAIYYSNEEEKTLANRSKNTLESSGKFEKAIATQIIPVSDFFEAEEGHQDYAQKQTLRYKAYEVGSGRAGYKKQVWSESLKGGYTDAELKQRLTPLQYKVTQKDGTERPFSDGNYHDNKEAGIYVDVVDGTPLYSSLHKYDSGTGWPSFWKSLDEDLLVYKEDNTLFSTRTEVRSKNADSHLGHVFQDGPSDKGGLRHCINGASLKFIPVDDLEKEGYGDLIGTFE